MPDRTVDHGSYKSNYYQFSIYNPDSKTIKPIKEAGWSNQEHLKKSYSDAGSTKVSTTEGRRVALSSQGVLRDDVGLVEASKGNFHTTQIFSNTAYRDGYPTPVTTQFKHVINRVDGALEVEASIYKP